MATIDDVAKKAKVSRMTVSRVINNSGYVKEETRLRINMAIDELKFKPNMIAKSLVTRKSRTIAYVMVNISDPFHNLVNKGFEAVAFENGYTTLMCDAHSASRVSDYINMLQERCIDGVVLHHLNITKKQVQELEASGVHCVLLDNEVELPEVNCVNTDNVQGARLAAEHLIKKGHTRIGCMHGTLRYPKTEKIASEDTFHYNIWKQRTQVCLNGINTRETDCRTWFPGLRKRLWIRSCRPLNRQPPFTAKMILWRFPSSMSCRRGECVYRTIWR